ncbi:hypothetical protein T492DRAFT_851093, partial [Pavlovales sp. CCMP2436]
MYEHVARPLSSSARARTIPDSDDEPEAEINLASAPPVPTASLEDDWPVQEAGADDWGVPDDLIDEALPMQRPVAAATAAASLYSFDEPAAPATAASYGGFDDSPYAGGVRSMEDGFKGLQPTTLRLVNTDDTDDDNSANDNDGLMSAVHMPEPEAGATVSAVSAAESRQALMNLVLWRNPVMTGGVFVVLAVLNVFSLLIIYGRFTVIGLLANVILLSILLHVLYRLASIAYMRFTNKHLDAYAAIKQRVGSRTVDFTS